MPGGEGNATHPDPGHPADTPSAHDHQVGTRVSRHRENGLGAKVEQSGSAPARACARHDEQVSVVLGGGCGESVAGV